MFDTHAPTHRVLIVDDELVPRGLESLALESTGRYYTIEARNGVDALTAMTGEKYDCAIIDLAMPDMSGDELVRMIRRDSENRDLPIVLVLPEGTLPGSGTKDHPGVTKVIAKPFDPWHLAQLVDSLTGAVSDPQHVLSVEAVLRGFPYPTMILDAKHHVILANGPFYEKTDTGVSECYVYCNEHLHDDEKVPFDCPLEEAIRTGAPVEHDVDSVMGRLRVAVYPLENHVGAGTQLFLHVTQPCPGSSSPAASM